MNGETFKFIKTSFLWTIDNFSLHLEDVGERIESSTFSTPDKDDLKWKLELYPHGKRFECEGYLSLYLTLESDCSDIDIEFKFSILSSTRKKFNSMEIVSTFVNNSSWGYTKFFPKSSLFEKKATFLPNDQLTIFCEITVLNYPEDIVDLNNDPLFKVSECSWSQDMNLLLESHNFSDVTIHVGDRMFQAHKNILAARSSLFEAMFEHEMKDQNWINITDVEPTVMQELLRFMYTGSSRNVEGMAEKLLAGAANYGLERLKVLCEMSLASALSPNNAGDVLVLADRYQAKQLKAFTIRFINTHSLAVIESEGWKSNLSQKPHLITDILMTEFYKFSICCEIVSSETNKIETSKYWSHTKDKVSSFLFKWTINRYSLRKPNRQSCIQSPIFFRNNDKSLKWRLEAYVDGLDDESIGFLSLFLKLETSAKTEVISKFELALINENGDRTNNKKFIYKFTNSQKKGSNAFVKNDFLCDKKNGLLPEDKLTIVCDIKVIEETIVTGGKNVTIQFQEPKSRWSEDMRSLLESHKFSDVALKACGHKVLAHKNILAARSPVFAAMFEHDMKENRESLVEIEDMEPEVLEEMVRFIYTGQSPKLDSMADRLLPAADMYGLERLKAMCEVSLASTLTSENAMKVLVLADTHNALQIKTHTMSFIYENFDEILKTEDLCLETGTQPQLLTEIYLTFALKRVQYFLPVEEDSTKRSAT
ncbi:SPOPL [Cordylochernes scorpioides]|uniref:SPOPL n=1 Tax=Cordylochernes scorpioides TaxID=51811 RepID=A0ABY6KM01_9ARAC|nr:SPOPL [Cordylochernes scorpioides]